VPKLNQDTAQKVDNAEDGFKPVEEGVYVLQLVEDVEVVEGPKGPYWKWTFEVPNDQPVAVGRKFFTNTSLSEAAFFKIKETFKAFGVPTDTDTEDLVGKRVKAVIGIRTIQGGSRKGELGNDITKLLPIDAEDPAVEDAKVSTDKASAKGGSKDEPLF